MNALDEVLDRLIELGRVSFSKYNRLYKVEIIIAGNTYDAESSNKLDAIMQLYRRVKGSDGQEETSQG